MPGGSNWTICSPLSRFCSDNFQFVSPLYWEANFYYPKGLIVRRGEDLVPIPKVNEKGGFECLGHSNWTICSPLSPFCCGNFQFVSSLYWEANSYYPRGLIVRRGKSPIPELNETGVFRCLGHSNWTICSPLSQFCSWNFSFVALSYWGAISYYPSGLIVRKGRFANSKSE